MSGLQRIILIDTHLKGVVELKLDAHSNICGTNASGKTTLQRLIPVFYGEYPSRVVPSTRDSFERWYLRNEASYIIYEYLQYNGQLAQVALSSGKEEQGVKYRFIAKGFELNDYIASQDETGLSFCKPGELGNHLKRQYKDEGLQLSTLLNTREYRSIIQNDRALQNAASRDVKLLARQFSMCDPKHSLRHIEKLAKAVHSKEGKMETIKSMIATILEEEGVSLKPTWVDANKAQSWIQESRLIQQFAAIRPQFVKLEQVYQALQVAEQRLACLQQYLQIDSAQQQALGEELTRQVQQAKLALKTLEDQWHQQRDALEGKLSKASADVKTYDAQLNDIEDAYQRWQDSDIEQAQAQLEQQPQWREQLSQVQADHQLLTEQHSDIEAQYNQRKSEVNEELNSSMLSLQEKKDQQQQALQQEQQQQQQDLNNFAQQQTERQGKIEQAFQLQQHQHELSLTQLKTQLAQMGFSEAEQRELQIMDNRLDEARNKQKQQQQHKEQAASQFNQASQQRSQADQLLRQASRHSQSQEHILVRIKAMVHPADGSLLAQLRDEHPGWEQQIGKLINPALLARCDLKPHSDENHHTFFGLSVDLKAIELPEYATDEQQRLAQLAAAEQDYNQAQQQQKQAEQSLANANQHAQQHELNYNNARVASDTAQDQLSRLEEEKQLLKERLQQQLQQRQQRQREQLSELEQSIAQSQQQHQSHLDEHQEQVQEAKLEKLAWWEEKLDSLSHKLSQAEQAIKQRQQQAKQALQQAENWYKGELKGRGVDEEKIILLSQQIRQLKQQISQIELRRDDISEFILWQQHVWLKQKPQLSDELQAARQAESAAKQTLAKAQAEFKEQRTIKLNQRQDYQQQQEQQQQRLDDCNRLLKRLSKLSLDRVKADNTEQQQVLLDERLRESEHLLQQQHQNLELVEQGVREFDKLIAQQSGSDLSDTWERERSQAYQDNEHGIKQLNYRSLVPRLAEILNNMVPQKIYGLIEHGRIYGKNIQDFYQNLLDIDKRIDSQSRRITREVGEDLSLDGVSGSAVKIRSKIRELDFWDELQEFVDNHQRWVDAGSSDLPDEDYALSMKRALEIIGKSALKDGISRLLAIELYLREGNSDLVIRTDRQLNESSSHGMAYLILCKFLLAFTRLLRGSADSVIHWPIDELGTLHQSNIKKIFQACDHNQIRILGAFPNPESEILSLFTHRYIIDREKRQLQLVKPRPNPLAEKLKQAQQAKQEAAL